MPSDEYYTPAWVTDEMVRTLGLSCAQLQEAVVWDPFPGPRRLIVERVESAHGLRTASYAPWPEVDAFEAQTPDTATCIVTNPPFSRLVQAMELLLATGLPFVTICPLQYPLYASMRHLRRTLAARGAQIVYPSRRIGFIDETGTQLKPPFFYSAYLAVGCPPFNAWGHMAADPQIHDVPANNDNGDERVIFHD